MAAVRAADVVEPKIPHEEFCLPPSARDPLSEFTVPRVESFTATRYDGRGNDLGPVRVWRCIDCGAARYINE